MRVVVIGGSGYAGQHIAAALHAHGHAVRVTYHARNPHAFDAVWCDLSSGEAVADAIRGMDVVVSCVAMSQPRDCENDEERARRVNVPLELLRVMSDEQLLVHLSTDHVYSGERRTITTPIPTTSLSVTAGETRTNTEQMKTDEKDEKDAEPYTELSETSPVNAYGRTKLEAERVIRQMHSKHVILRPSVIFGKETPMPVSRPLFLQWAMTALEAQIRGDAGAHADPPTFWTDEMRSPTYVGDLTGAIVRIVDMEAAHNGCSSENAASRIRGETFNIGGPVPSLSRADLAMMMAVHGGGDPALVKTAHVPPNRLVKIPVDLSMRSTKIEKALGITLTDFASALHHIFPPPPL